MLERASNPIVERIQQASPEGQELRRRIMTACAAAGSPLTVQAVFAWRHHKGGVPPSRVAIVAKALGAPKSEIRPDLFEAGD